MKSILIAIVLALAVPACVSSTEYGKCIGIVDREDPKLDYKLSIWNTFLSVVFVETIILPIYVLATETKCPEGRMAE